MTLDLRRRARLDRNEMILARVGWLTEQDRAVLEGVFRTGQTVRELARLLGVSERKLGRRVHRLVERVLSDRFAFVMRHHGRWSPARRRVAVACVLEGRSVRAARGDLGLSMHTIRGHLAAVDAMLEGVSDGAHEAAA